MTLHDEPDNDVSRSSSKGEHGDCLFCNCSCHNEDYGKIKSANKPMKTERVLQEIISFMHEAHTQAWDARYKNWRDRMMGKKSLAARIELVSLVGEIWVSVETKGRFLPFVPFYFSIS